MKHVLLLGAGKIGTAIATYLRATGDYDVLVADVNEQALATVAEHAGVETIKLDVTNKAELLGALKGRDAVLSALSFRFNPAVAEAALEAGASYFDLTEDVETTRRVKEIAKKAKEGQIFMPQCGLAPGFVGIVAYDLAKRLESIDSVQMRVGALPMYPTNMLKYNLTWSTDGLINEYCNPCEAIHRGQRIEMLALEGLEHFSVDGVRYEAFNTSGGLGTLCETLDGRVDTLNYKTVRYLGHRDLADFLINELRMNNKRDTLKSILEDSVPMTTQDVVIVFCTVTGMVEGRYSQITDARKIYHGEVEGEHWSAIQITTAAGICTVLDLHIEGKLPSKGFIRQEEVALPDFLANRFGRYYDFAGHPAVTVKQVEAVIEND
ncbi:saccharopine dehydrogenase family protein [Mucisphaera calidilacus]|uniref:Lysine 6-dehydrogenase n=1 Tax=Mucisphaera calidilacus TaxID=2527982 RepID=A0A518BWM9_9BACT|nr:saccharopine dehydrogenase NADP-binding domain-containing protein [Mucisphaera calidilacus]QDU71334.1 Lysine 6-dehydrogenase [Mucisphaera calidilacus]